MTNEPISPGYSKLQKTLINLSVFLSYFLLGWGSLSMATINQFASPIWVPTGFAIGMMLLFGSWLAPAIFAGALLTNLTTGGELLGVIGIATGNMLEAIAGATILQWVLEKKFLKITRN